MSNKRALQKNLKYSLKYTLTIIFAYTNFFLNSEY